MKHFLMVLFEVSVRLGIAGAMGLGSGLLAAAAIMQRNPHLAAEFERGHRYMRDHNSFELAKLGFTAVGVGFLVYGLTAGLLLVGMSRRRWFDAATAQTPAPTPAVETPTCPRHTLAAHAAQPREAVIKFL